MATKKKALLSMLVAMKLTLLWKSLEVMKKKVLLLLLVVMKLMLL